MTDLRERLQSALGDAYRLEKELGDEPLGDLRDRLQVALGGGYRIVRRVRAVIKQQESS